MTILVEGFMSRIGALQFEWAWQHTNDSRHARLGQMTGEEGTAASRVTIDAAAGKAKPQRRRTRRSMKAHLEDLHVLLRSNYFSNWPLRVRFFSADVYRQWKAWSDRVDDSLPSHIQIILDGDCDLLHNQTDKGDKVESVHNIQTRYTNIDEYLEKAALLLDDPTDLRCKICHGRVIPKDELVVVCPQTACHCTSHMSCLSASFLAAAGEPDRFVPMHGTCPACKKTIKWPVIMQEMTLRRRGDKELRAILRKKKRRDNQNRKKDAKGVQGTATTEQDSFDDSADDDALDENWIEEQASESDSDTEIPNARSKPAPPRLEIVIEDSEDD